MRADVRAGHAPQVIVVGLWRRGLDPQFHPKAAVW